MKHRRACFSCAGLWNRRTASTYHSGLRFERPSSTVGPATPAATAARRNPRGCPADCPWCVPAARRRLLDVLPPADQVEPPPIEPDPWTTWRANNRTGTYGISSDHSALQLHTLPDLPCSLTRGLRTLQLAAAARRRAASDHFTIILNSHLDDRARRISEATAELGTGDVPGPVADQLVLRRARIEANYRVIVGGATRAYATQLGQLRGVKLYLRHKLVSRRRQQGYH